MWTTPPWTPICSASRRRARPSCSPGTSGTTASRGRWGAWNGWCRNMCLSRWTFWSPRAPCSAAPARSGTPWSSRRRSWAKGRRRCSKRTNITLCWCPPPTWTASWNFTTTLPRGCTSSATCTRPASSSPPCGICRRSGGSRNTGPRKRTPRYGCWAKATAGGRNCGRSGSP